MLIRKKDIRDLSYNIKQAINGESIDFRDNKEGEFSILKNDLYSFITSKNEEINIETSERKLSNEYIENISHQLKTPITSMNIMMDLLEDASPKKQAEFIANIKQSLLQMEWLTTSLMKLARLDNKMIAFNPKNMQVSNLLERALKPLEISLDIKNQKVELVNDINIYCDEKWTSEALTNLIKNAIEHSPNESVIKLNSGENPIYKYISITDCGTGIKKEDYKKLFIRFESSQSKSGYGIGLPLALSIVRSQNGDIDVDLGGKGKGATFTIKLFK